MKALYDELQEAGALELSEEELDGVSGGMLGGAAIALFDLLGKFFKGAFGLD